MRKTLIGAAVLLRLAAGQNVVTTIAGIDPVFTGDGLPAISVPIGYPNGLATDSNGNVYLTDPIEHLVLKIATDGTLSVIAGNGIAGYSGDGGQATLAAIASTDLPVQYTGPTVEVSLGGLDVDKNGNVYFADGHYVRRIDRNGIITTVAGGGSASPGDDGPATQASLGIVTGVALNNAGTLFFSEGNRVRRVSGGVISTFAGTGENGFSGDKGPATAAQLSQPLGLVFDGSGSLYIADGDGVKFTSRIRKIAQTGIITTYAGGGTLTPQTGAVPTTLDLTGASGLAVDSSGTLYVYAAQKGTVLKFPSNSTVVLTHIGQIPFADNIPASGAYVAGQRLYDNSGIAVDASGNVYLSDTFHGRVRKIDTNGKISTVAGNGQYGLSGDSGPALGAAIQGPSAMTQTPDGSIYFTDTLNQRVRKITPDGLIGTVLSIDNFPPIEAVNGIASDPSGNVYVALANRVVQITPTGKINNIVDQAGKAGDTGDGGPANQATIQSAGSLARDSAGNLFLSDLMANRIRKITPDGTISTIAGNGTFGLSPDGAIAANFPVAQPTAMLPDGKGGLYFEESPTPLGGSIIRYITPAGLFKTIAGNQTQGYSGDGGAALTAQLSIQRRTGLALDPVGNFYVADGFNKVVRVISPAGIIQTYAGNGRPGNTGDGGLPLNASFNTPRGLLFDSKADLLISDVSGNRIRAVLAAPPSFTAQPAQLSFAGKAGGAQTPPQQLVMQSPVDGLAFNLTVNPAAPWLIFGTKAGATPRLINIRADPSNLTPGAYQTTITITAPLGTPTSTTVSVSFVVTAGDPPKLDIRKRGLSFTFPVNASSTRAQVVPLFNVGTGSLAFSSKVQTSRGGNWLSVNPATGSITPQAPVDLSVTTNPNGLAVGTYTGTVTVSSPTSGDSIPILITMTISTLDQAIQLSHPALSFIAVAQGGIVPPRTFTITNIGRGAMNFTVSTQTLSGGQWLSATPTSGTSTNGVSPPVIVVSANQTALAPGTYYGLVRVDSSGAANTPRVLTVALRVLPNNQDPGPVIEPSEIVFTATQGATPPGAMYARVYNLSATPQTYVSNVNTGNPNYTFGLIPGSATLGLNRPTRLVIQPLTSNLTPGVYESDLTLQFSDGYVRRLGIRTVITAPAPGSSSSSNSKAEDGAAGCSATSLVPAVTTLGQSFGVPAAWPVSLEAEVLDDCGNPLSTGSVVVSFSNGDPPLSLLATDSGLWANTWSSGNNSGPVTLTVTASDPTRNLTGTREVTGGLGDTAPAPVLGAAVSGASFAANTPLAPQSIVTLFGQNLGNGSASATALPLSTTLAGSSVLMAGSPVPLIYSSTGQINALTPAGLNVNTNYQVVVQRDNTLSIPVSVDVGPTEPAIFSYPAPGDPTTQGAIVNAVTYVVAHPGTPATAGDVLAIFCTGLGAVDQPVTDGAAAPSSPLANAVTPPTVTIGGQNAQVAFAGLSPGFVGLYQIDVVVPSGVTPGNQVPVVLSSLGATSPALTIAIK